MILTFTTVPEELRETRFTLELLEHLSLFNHLRPSHLELLQLDSHFLASLDILAQIDLAKGARSDHLAHLEATMDPHLITVLTIVMVLAVMVKSTT